MFSAVIEAVIMSHSTAEKRRVFLAYRSLFSGENANLRQAKKIRKLVKEHSSSFEALIKDFGSCKTVGNILKALLEVRVFESDIQAKIAFPELFQTTTSRSVQRAAFENEAASSEAEALEKLVSEGRINEYDRDGGIEECMLLPLKLSSCTNCLQCLSRRYLTQWCSKFLYKWNQKCLHCILRPFHTTYSISFWQQPNVC
jgi:hypothetical protein